MKLSMMFEQAPDIEIVGISSDSRKIQPGYLYFCLEGMMHDGHDYVESAIAQGAVCIVHTKAFDHYAEGVAYIKVKDMDATLNLIASKFYGHPSQHMHIFGITGTNGKTTVASIIEDVYGKFVSCGYIGTVGTHYGDVVLEPTLTTPDAIALHKTMKDMLDHGVKACAMEVSSHGLELHRVDRVAFDVAIFTNLTYDHLDFHGTIDNYFEAKKKLFLLLPEDKIAILNRDDPYYPQLKESCKAKLVTYGLHQDATYRADHIRIGLNGSTFTLYHQDKEYEVHTNLVALYNIYNLLAAIAAMHVSNMPLEDIIQYINHVKQIEGRMERIDEGQPFTVIVDFAHTPDGLTKVFEYAKEITDENRNIIAVFGSAGKRDTKKRKVFGEIASKYCNMIILTEDDPRDEDPREIANEIRSGIQGVNSIYIENRYDAIRQAIDSANAGDCILLLGKGDEVFMHRELGKEPWIGDHNAARHCIRKYYLGIEEA